MSDLHEDIITKMVSDIMPDIQQSLTQELMAELQDEFEDQLRHEEAKIQAQAQQEYEMALMELEEQLPKIEREQNLDLVRQLERLQSEREIQSSRHMQVLHDRYISENFHELILCHPKIKQLEEELEETIRQDNQGKIQALKQRKIKELLVKLETKEHKDRIARDEAIKKQRWEKRGIDGLKKDIEILRIGIASMKSEYNVKIKKVQTEIKEIKAKNQSLQPKEDINKLREELQRLQDEKDRVNEQILQQDNQMQMHNESYSRNYSHYDSSEECSFLRQVPAEARYYDNTENAVMESDEEDYSSSQPSSTSNFEQDDIAQPPAYHPSYVEEDSLEKQQISYGPILGIDIGKMLRSNWQSDPLQKYLQDQTQASTDKENVAESANRSNFQQMYHQHLEKLNKGSQRRKLSTNAKKTIIRNLSLLGRNSFTTN